MSIYNWMHKLGFEHLKGRLIYVKTRTELDRIKELEEQVLRLKQSLADEVLDHKIDVEFLKIACRRAGTSVEDLKKALPKGADFDILSSSETAPTSVAARVGP